MPTQGETKMQCQKYTDTLHINHNRKASNYNRTILNIIKFSAIFIENNKIY